MATEQEFLQLSAYPNYVDDYTKFNYATSSITLQWYRGRLDTATEDVPVVRYDPSTGEYVVEWHSAHLYTDIKIITPYDTIGDLYIHDIEPASDQISGTIGAWVTTQAVPIPASFWFFITGLVMLFRFQNNGDRGTNY